MPFNQGLHVRARAGALATLIGGIGCRTAAPPPVVTEPAASPEPTAVVADATNEPPPEVAPEASLERGVTLLKAGKFSEAAEECDAVRWDDEANVLARDCSVLAYMGLHQTDDAYSSWGSCGQDETGECVLSYARFLREAGHPIEALTMFGVASRSTDEPATALKEIAHTRPLVDAILARATTEVTGGDYRSTEAMTPRAFGRALAALATEAKGIESLFHPDLGVFVVHTPGALAMLDNVKTWPPTNTDHAYAGDVGEDVIKTMRRAGRWKPGRTARIDSDGCEPLPDTVLETQTSAFDVWTVQFGSEYWALPQELWLTPVQGHASFEIHGLDETLFPAMRAAALAITHTAVVDGSRFDFGRINGRWYLLAMDLSDSLCG